MANHKSCIKRLRQTKTRTEHNKYYAKTMRNAVRLAKTNLIHKNKAANLKSSLQLQVNKLA